MRYSFSSITNRVKERFHSKYVKQPTGCWEWTAFRDKRDGYGWFRVGKLIAVAHRVSWVIANECDWPADKPEARHLCNNSRCVNPSHIEPGTNLENAKDRVACGNSKGSKISCVKCRKIVHGHSNIIQHSRACNA